MTEEPNLIYWAIPGFVALLVLEGLAFRFLRDETLAGYDARDTATSLSMGLGNVAINVGWKGVVLAVYTVLYELTPLRLPVDAWWTWVLLFLADDLAYYAYHRSHHEVRILWASHVIHHSSERYNLSTALRQTWFPMTGLPFWAPLALLGFAPWTILTMQSVSLIYQFFLHTECVGKLPRPIELVFNTPSHHRVHHGSNARYLDKNHAGTLIVWDRLFGSFQEEDEKVVYGLTKSVGTFNPLRVATHEIGEIVRDARTARSWRDRLGFVLRGPGWEPAEA